MPEDVQFSDLDRAVRARLRTLSKDNAQQVGLHLVMTGRLLDSDPELAYEHAQAAVRRAGRVDVVREAAGLAAYRTGRFAEALRELRTVRRLNGSSEHLAVMADCERGLGRPERALALAASDEAEGLDPEVRVELAMVVSGARLDLGEPEAALAVLSSGAVAAVPAGGVLAARVAQARAAALEALGRHDDAAAEVAPFSAADLAEAAGDVEDDVVVFDLEEDADSVDADPDAVDGSDHATDAVDAEDVAEAADALAEAQAEDADVETSTAEDADVESSTEDADVESSTEDADVESSTAEDDVVRDAGGTDASAVTGGEDRA